MVQAFVITFREGLGIYGQYLSYLLIAVPLGWLGFAMLKNQSRAAGEPGR